MDKRTGEAVRYLGYGNHAVDEDTLGLIEASFSELSETAKKRIVYRIFELQTPDDEQVIIGNYLVKSRNLARNLQGCEKVVLLGATLGAGVDLLLRRYALTEVASDPDSVPDTVIFPFSARSRSFGCWTRQNESDLL